MSKSVKKKLKNQFLQKIKNHSRTLEKQSRDLHKATKSIAMVQIVFLFTSYAPKVVSQICRKHIRPDPITSKFVPEITILSRRGGECFAPTRPTMCVGRSPKLTIQRCRIFISRLLLRKILNFHRHQNP